MRTRTHPSSWLRRATGEQDALLAPTALDPDVISWFDASATAGPEWVGAKARAEYAGVCHGTRRVAQGSSYAYHFGKATPDHPLYYAGLSGEPGHFLAQENAGK